jgi:hypothetical protein
MIMEEWEALIQRRQMLLDKVSKINYEVEKIEQRLDLLGRMTSYEEFDRYRTQERLMQMVS